MMAEAEEEAAPTEEQQPQLSSSSSGPEDSQAAAVLPGEAEKLPAKERPPEERPAESREARCGPGGVHVEPTLDQFKARRFFVLRPGTLDQAIKDVKALVDKEVDGSVHSIWLMAEVDHWNNEKERLVLITDHTLLVFKYDFIMFQVEQIQKIALNFIDRISHGTFSFPKRSLLQREGEGVRVFWDRLREPSFSSRWNPFATDFPFITFTYHPVRNINDTFTALCDIQNFREKLKDAAQKAHTMKPVPGKANGVLVLNQQINVEAYVGAMSFLGNENKLGYSMARGKIGF